jgi:hypothetical protein
LREVLDQLQMSKVRRVEGSPVNRNVLHHFILTSDCLIAEHLRGQS